VSISALAVTRDSKLLISGSEDGTIKTWDLKKFEEVHQFLCVHEGIN